MSFVNLPVLAVAIGAFVLVAALFAMQWLRARTTMLKVATAQFWRQAVQQAPARAWWQQFRYWFAWLLSVCIALLLWLALSGIQLTSNTVKRPIFYYLDNSAAMQIANRFDDAKHTLLNDIDRSGTEQHQVWLGDASPSLLLQKRENSALLSPRLASVNATVHDNSFWQWLDDVIKLESNSHQIDVYYYGTALPQALKQQLPSTIVFHARYIAPAIERNMGIVALGQAPAASGEWGRVDVMFTLYSSDQRPLTASLVKFALNGRWFQPNNIVQQAAGEFVIRDVSVASTPQQLTVSLAEGDQFPADDSATLSLAVQPTIKVQMQAGLPQWLTTLIQLNIGTELVEQDADVAICRQDDATCPKAAATLYLDSSSNVAKMIALSKGEYASMRLVWQQHGWQMLAAQQQFPELELGVGKARQVHLNDATLQQLFKDESEQLPNLMLFSLRWLAHRDSFIPYLAVNQPWPNSAVDRSVALVKPTPLLAGKQQHNASAIVASLLSKTTSAAVTEVNDTEVEHQLNNSPFISPMWCCMLLALLLLLGEWVLLQRGRLP